MPKRAPRPKRLDQAELVETAWYMAYVEGLTFNVWGIAARVGMTPNRHFRATLNRLAARGLLNVARVLYDDGHYRKVFSAQRPLTGLEHTIKRKEKSA